MKVLVFFSRLVILLALCMPAQQVWATVNDTGWEYIEPGIDYREYTVAGPNRVFVARMDRSAQDVILDTSIAQGRLIYGGEKVSDMARRYDDALNFAENPSGTVFGYRNQVVVAINGGFVVPGTTIPYGGVIQSGWYAKRYEPASGAAFGWKYDVDDVSKRQVFIGDCVYHNLTKQYVRNISTNEKILINAVNTSRPSNSMVLYTPQYNTNTLTSSDGVEMLVEMRRASLILSEPWGAKGIVKQVRIGAGSTMIPFDHIVLSAHGTAATILRNMVVEGDEIEVDQEIINCTVPSTEPNWVKTYAGLTGDHTFLKAGVIIPHPNPDKNTDVHPRTAVAFNDQYIYFVVVDGRQPGVSVGMTYVQLAAFSKDFLGASWGMALDGGGSSTMVINGMVMNIPSDSCTWKVFLPYVRSNQQASTEAADASHLMDTDVDVSALPSMVCERLVGSGLMMIVLQDPQISNIFTPGDRVLVQVDAQVRLGPGTNYALLGSVPAGTQGTVLHQISDLDGIYAKGQYWWKVSFGNLVGWVSQNNLVWTSGYYPLQLEREIPATN